MAAAPQEPPAPLKSVWGGSAVRVGLHFPRRTSPPLLLYIWGEGGGEKHLIFPSLGRSPAPLLASTPKSRVCYSTRRATVRYSTCYSTTAPCCPLSTSAPLPLACKSWRSPVGEELRFRHHAIVLPDSRSRLLLPLPRWIEDRRTSSTERVLTAEVLPVAVLIVNVYIDLEIGSRTTTSTTILDR